MSRGFARDVALALVSTGLIAWALKHAAASAKRFPIVETPAEGHPARTFAWGNVAEWVAAAATIGTLGVAAYGAVAVTPLLENQELKNTIYRNKILAANQRKVIASQAKAVAYGKVEKDRLARSSALLEKEMKISICRIKSYNLRSKFEYHLSPKVIGTKVTGRSVPMTVGSIYKIYLSDRSSDVSPKYKNEFQKFDQEFRSSDLRWDYKLRDGSEWALRRAPINAPEREYERKIATDVVKAFDVQCAAFFEK